MEWIKKTEKTPAITSGFFNCLIVRKDKEIRQARFNCKTQRFQTMDFDDIDEVVTHWMPLPELPSA